MTALDVGRTRRALGLQVEQLTNSEYLVSGGSEPHTVERDGSGWRCDCADARFNPGRACKHRLASYLHRRLDARVRDALRAATGL